MTVRLTDLGRSWLAPWQRRLADQDGRMTGRIHARLTLDYDVVDGTMYELFFPAQGMVLWVTQPEFERSH